MRIVERRVRKGRPVMVKLENGVWYREDDVPVEGEPVEADGAVWATFRKPSDEEE